MSITTETDSAALIVICRSYNENVQDNAGHITYDCCTSVYQDYDIIVYESVTERFSKKTDVVWTDNSHTKATVAGTARDCMSFAFSENSDMLTYA